jgi:hypothetical protein
MEHSDILETPETNEPAAVDRVLETGRVVFLYRPRVDRPDPHSLEDVQRFYLALDPDAASQCRLAVVGRKRLPDTRPWGERFWGFVDRVGEGRVREELEERTYQTKTRGRRHQPPARRAGEGRYRIFRHADHTHFAYALQRPDEPGDVQRDMRIDPEASYIIAVKNPRRPWQSPDKRRDPDPTILPDRLQARFQGRRWIAVDPPEFLDHEGVEFVLIGASDHFPASAEPPQR